jgi:hypothetical protein
MPRETSVRRDAETATPDPAESEAAPEKDSAVEEMRERLAMQSKLIARLEADMRDIKKAAKPPAEERPEEKTLTERQRLIEERFAQKEKASNAKAIRLALSSALHKEGVTDANVATRQAKFLMTEFDGRLTVGGDDDSVAIDDNGTHVPLEKFLHAYLQTEDASWLLPTKRPPNDRAAASGNAVLPPAGEGKMQLTRAQYIEAATRGSKQIREKIAKGDFDIVDG